MTASTPARSTWVDTAKGIAILLVVLYHAIILSARIGLETPWEPTAELLSTFRMPLFFFLAGLFAARLLDGSLRKVVRRRVTGLVWLYIVWSVVLFLVLPLAPLPGRIARDGWALALLPVKPDPNTWFLHALALYFVAAWLLRRLPPAAGLTAAAALSITAQLNVLDSGNVSIDKIMTNFVFFLAATHLARAALSAIPRMKAWYGIALLGVYAAGTVAAAKLGGFDVPGVHLVLACVGIAAGCAIAWSLSRYRWSHALASMGRNTLPIYVLHFIPLVMIASALSSLRLEWNTTSASALPLVMTAVAVGTSLLVHRSTARIPGLWSAPSFLTGAARPSRPPAVSVAS